MHVKRGSFYGDHFISFTGTDAVPDRPNFGYQLLLLLIYLKHPDFKQACDCSNNVPPYHWSCQSAPCSGQDHGEFRS